MNLKKYIPNSEGIIEDFPLNHWLNRDIEDIYFNMIFNKLRYFWIRYDVQICISALILIALISLSGG